MARIHGGTLTDEEKKKWEEQAEKEGFDNLWNWIKWAIRQRLEVKK
jgi:hypothetical protein